MASDFVTFELNIRCMVISNLLLFHDNGKVFIFRIEMDEQATVLHAPRHCD